MGAEAVVDELMSPAGAAAVQELLAGWPDEQSKSDHRKIEAYWAYFERKRAAFDGVFAFGVRGAPGRDATPYLVLTFDTEGKATVRQAEESEAVGAAKLAIETKFDDWVSLVDGYDIGKAMTYHMLPLRSGTALEMLRNAYFVHELIVVLTRVAAGQKVPA